MRTIRLVHLRRALLLFAIVLGLAALAASMSRTRDSDPAQETTPSSATPSSPSPSAEPQAEATPAPSAGTTLSFDAERDQSRALETGRAAVVEVSVDEPGQVSIPLLGLDEPAQPLTPARFDVLVSDEGDYPLVFAPAAGDEEREVGTLVVEPAAG